MSGTSRGLAAATAAFAMWGAFPLYFHALYQVSAFQVIAHRVIWSCAFVLIWMGARGELSGLRAVMGDRGVLGRLIVTAVLITINWTVYVWAVINGHVVEASLGYFTGPLVNVLLGVVLLSERLTRVQWTAIALAASGVIYLAAMAGSPPWIALTLAFSFGTYGLLRKVVKVEALPGLAVETVVLLPFAVAFLLWCEYLGTGVLGHAGPAIDALLIGSGPLTAIGLFLFAYGTRRLPYSTVGILQYIAPTGQLLCGVLAFHEPFEKVRATGFALIWIALLLYTTEGFRLSRKQQGAFA
jgi:chloramphenicol-sensitive protein RarD